MSENTNTTSNTDIDTLRIRHEAVHGADGSSLTEMGHAREELWFRKHDAELIARMKAKQAANTDAMSGSEPGKK